LSGWRGRRTRKGAALPLPSRVGEGRGERGRSGRSLCYPPPVLPQQRAAAAGGYCRLPLTAARPVQLQQGAAAAGRSAAGSSCCYPLPYLRRRAAAVAYNACYTSVSDNRAPIAYNTSIICPIAAAAAVGDTTAAAAAGSLPPAQRGVQGGARPLALSGSCSCIAAVPERVERRQRCQLPTAGAAAATGAAERATGGGRLVSAGARSSVRAPRESARVARPSHSSAADAAWVGCRGSQRQRRGCRNTEGVATPGALAGAASLRTAAAIPRTALRYREYLPCGAAAAGQLLLSGSAVRASRGCCTYQRGSAYRVKEQQPPITFPLRSGGCRGVRTLSGVHGQE
jgi:hypothetical protein